MPLVIDTNVLISALLDRHTPPFHLVRAWVEEEAFELFTHEEQLTELRGVTRREKLRRFIPPHLAGKLVNDLVRLATKIENTLPLLDLSRDPADNFLLAMAQASEADYLVTGDKRDLLTLKRLERTQIVTVRQMINLLGI